MRTLLAALALVFWAGSVVPALADNQVTSFTLNNGMEVVVIEDNRAPLVVHMVWYRVGAADEPAGISGIAHFLEHLMFKGTDTVDSGELSATVAKNGGSDNAFTSFDYTAYFQRVASDRLELMMQLESDRMVNLLLEDEEVLTERSVIVEERKQQIESDPGRVFSEQMRAAQYLNHSYGAPIIGWPHEITELSKQDALSFYKAHYAPNNAILVVGGDVTPKTVLELAKKYYGAIPANPDIVERKRPSEPPQLVPRHLVLEDPRVGQPYVMRSYMAPERDSGAQKKAAALTFLAEILGGGTTSILSQKLQFETNQAVYSASWYSGNSLDDTTFNIIIAPTPEYTLQQMEDAMDEIIGEFMKTGVPEGDLERIKRQFRAAEIYERDSVRNLVHLYGASLAQGLTIKDIQAWPDILQAVTEEDIMAAARDVFDDRKSVTGWLKTPEVTQ